MPTTTEAPLHTENGEAFGTVTEELHPHGEDPDVDVPQSADELSDQLGRLAGKLHNTSLILRRVTSHFETTGDESELGTIMTAEGLADRSHERLQEAADALSKEHTENVGWRMHEVTLPVGNAHKLLCDWMGGYPSDKAQQLSGSIYATIWTLDYVEKRLNFLVEESDVYFLD